MLQQRMIRLFRRKLLKTVIDCIRDYRMVAFLFMLINRKNFFEESSSTWLINTIRLLTNQSVIKRRLANRNPFSRFLLCQPKTQDFILRHH